MSQAKSGYERADLDKYYTQPWAVDALLDVEEFPGLVIDPCAGGWDIVITCRRRNVLCDGFDIEPEPPRGFKIGRWGRKDFFAWDGRSPFGEPYRSIITNFPFGSQGRMAHKMIQRSLELLKPVKGKMAVLLRADFDSGRSRRDIFGECPAFAARYVLTKRISWTNVPVKLDARGNPVGPTENHMWCVWDWSRRKGKAPVVGYLP